MKRIAQALILLLCCCAVCAAHAQAIVSLDMLDTHERVLSAEPVELSEALAGSAVVWRIRYESDGCEVVGFVSAPADYLERAYPVLIWNRGGNQAFGQLTADTPTGLATLGYIVLASQYRGVDGGTGTEQFGGDDIHDVLRLIDISEAFAFAQPGGVYMAGASRGGMMTYIACRQDARIRAAAVLAGVSDLTATYNGREASMKRVLKTLVGGPPEALPEAYALRSAVCWAEEIDVPLLILHGGAKDWRVDTAQARDMAALLAAHGKEYKLIVYEEADHSLSGTPVWEEMGAWFAAHPLAP